MSVENYEGNNFFAPKGEAFLPDEMAEGDLPEAGSALSMEEASEVSDGDNAIDTTDGDILTEDVIPFWNSSEDEETGADGESGDVLVDEDEDEDDDAPEDEEIDEDAENPPAPPAASRSAASAPRDTGEAALRRARPIRSTRAPVNKQERMSK